MGREVAMEGRRGKEGRESLAHPRGHTNLPHPKAAVQGPEKWGPFPSTSGPITPPRQEQELPGTMGIRAFLKAAEHDEKHRAMGGIAEASLKDDQGNCTV